MARYSIGIYDCAGQYGSTVETDYLDMARVVQAALRVRYPTKHVLVFDGEQDGRAIEDEDEEDVGGAA